MTSRFIINNYAPILMSHVGTHCTCVNTLKKILKTTEQTLWLIPTLHKVNFVSTVIIIEKESQ